MNKFADYIPLLELNIYSIIIDILKSDDAQKVLINYNQESQLQEGIDALGQKIYTEAAIKGEVYSSYTIGIKGQKGQPFDKVTLFDTGEFYDSMRVRVTDEETEITGDFDKPDGNIYDNFTIGKFDFLGLTKENLEGFVWYYLFDILEKRLQTQL